MSDSQSDGLEIPLEAGDGGGSKESISTENDTEADIEEMESIASYEVPIEEAEIKKTPEPVESKPSTVLNSSKKEPTVESKKDVAASKKDVAASKKDVAASKKDVIASKKDIAASKKDVVPSKKDAVPSKKDVVPSKKDVAPSKKDVIPLKKDATASKVDSPNQQKESATVKIPSPSKESLSSKPLKPTPNDAVQPSSELSIQPVAVDEDPPCTPKEDTKLSDKSKSDKVSEKHSKSQSKKGSKSLSHNSQSKSTNKSFSKDIQSDKKLKDESKVTGNASLSVMQTSSAGGKSFEEGIEYSGFSSRRKKESYNSPSAESSRSKHSTDNPTSKSPYSESMQESLTKPTHHSERKVPQTRSISITSHARMETTPSYHKSLVSTETEQFSIADTNDIVSVSVSSGLQSIRDIFFDEDDSHKGYLRANNKGLFDASYCSHNHKSDKSEQFFGISQPSFNSHLEAPVRMLSDVDEDTFTKNSKHPERHNSDDQIDPG